MIEFLTCPMTCHARCRLLVTGCFRSLFFRSTVERLLKEMIRVVSQ